MNFPRRWHGLVQALAFFTLCTGLARAGDIETVLGLQSDKVQRGFSQSGGDAVASADARWRGDAGWLLNGGLSTLGRERQRGRAELLLGGGWASSGDGDWTWQATGSAYRTLGGGEAARAPYEELALSLDWTGRAQLLLAAAPSYPGPLPGGARGRGLSAQAEFGWHQRLVPGWSLDLGYGYVRYTRILIPDHNYGSAGLAWTQGRLTLAATRVFSNTPGQKVGPKALLALAWQL